MSWVGAEMLQFYLAEDRCGLLDPSGEAHWYESRTLLDGLTICLRAADLPRRRAWQRRSTAAVWTSGALIRPLLLGPVAGLSKPSEVHRFIQTQVAEATGLTAPCETQVEGDIAKEPVLVSAMVVDLREQIEAAVNGAGMQLKSLRPWWAAVLDAALDAQPDLQLLVVEDTDSSILLAGNSGSWSTVEAYTPSLAYDQTRSTIRRLSSGAGIGAGLSAWYRFSAVDATPVGHVWPAAHLLPDARQP